MDGRPRTDSISSVENVLMAPIWPLTSNWACTGRVEKNFKKEKKFSYCRSACFDVYLALYSGFLVRAEEAVALN